MKRFDVEVLEQSHWYLSAIHQEEDFNITLDQARYYKAIVNGILKKAGAEKKPKFIILFCWQTLLSVWDSSKDEETAEAMKEEKGVDFASYIGTLIPGTTYPFLW